MTQGARQLQLWNRHISPGIPVFYFEHVRKYIFVNTNSMGRDRRGSEVVVIAAILLERLLSVCGSMILLFPIWLHPSYSELLRCTVNYNFYGGDD